MSITFNLNDYRQLCQTSLWKYTLHSCCNFTAGKRKCLIKLENNMGRIYLRIVFVALKEKNPQSKFFRNVSLSNCDWTNCLLLS